MDHSFAHSLRVFAKKNALNIFPETLSGNLQFYLLPAPILHLVTLFLAFLHPTPLSFFLAPSVILGLILTLRLRTFGLGISYALLALLATFFYSKIPWDQCAWQMGIIFAFALQQYIALLCVEEFDSLAFSAHEEVNLLSVQHLEEKAEWQKEKEDFSAELQKWKEEAHQRKIEKHADEKRLSLAQSEIEILTQHKEQLVTEVMDFRKKAALLKQEQEEFTASRARNDEEFNRLVTDKKHLEAEVARVEVSLSQMLKDKEVLKLTLEEVHLEKEIIEEEMAKIQNSYTQLQQEHKDIQALGSDRLKNALQAQTTLESEVVHLRAKLVQIDLEREAVREVQEKCALVLQEKTALEVEMAKVHNALADNGKEKEELLRRCAQVEGLYLQLRAQFEEKSKVLTATRKDLFHLQGKVFANERERDISAFEGKSQELERDLLCLDKENQQLENENLLLEELISLINLKEA